MNLRKQLERLSPYQALFVLAVPLSIVEPLKLAAAIVVGQGHWAVGTVTLVVAYAVSIILIHALFKILKPKLLKLRWLQIMWTFGTETISGVTRLLGWR